MFLVSDGNRKYRKEVVDRVAGEDMVLRVLLTAIDFEWTLRRTILAMGWSPTKVLASKFDQIEYRKIEGLKKLWNDEVVVRWGKGTPTVVELMNEKPFVNKKHKRSWDCLCEAWNLRHKLVHGLQGCCGEEHGRRMSEVLIFATDRLVEFAEKHNKNVFRMIRRTKTVKHGFMV